MSRGRPGFCAATNRRSWIVCDEGNLHVGLQQMNQEDIEILKQNYDSLVRIRTCDGEVITALVKFVSDIHQDLVYDLVSTTRESQYEKHDEQPVYRLDFEEIESVEAVGRIADH